MSSYLNVNKILKFINSTGNVLFKKIMWIIHLMSRVYPVQYFKMVYKTFIYLLVFHLCKKSIRASQIGQVEATGDGPRIPPVQKTLSSSDMHLFTESTSGLWFSNPKTYTPNSLIPGQLHAFDSCSYDDFACLSMAASDKHGLEAIVTLHKQLDDDADGNIDFSESDDVSTKKLDFLVDLVKKCLQTSFYGFFPTLCLLLHLQSSLIHCFCLGSSWKRSWNIIQALRSARGPSTKTMTCTSQLKSCGRPGSSLRCIIGLLSKPLSGLLIMSIYHNMFLIFCWIKLRELIYPGKCISF